MFGKGHTNSYVSAQLLNYLRTNFYESVTQEISKCKIDSFFALETAIGVVELAEHDLLRVDEWTEDLENYIIIKNFRSIFVQQSL